MALPSGITPKTVNVSAGSFADGTETTGRVTLLMPVNVVHLPTGQPIYSGDRTRSFANGEVQFTLCPNDASGLNRVDWTYGIRVEIQGAAVQPPTIWFNLPTDGPDVVDVDKLVSVPSTAGTPVSPVVVTSVNGQTGVVVLDADDVGAQPAGSYATTQALSDGLVGKVNSSTYTAGIAAAKDRANHTGTQTSATIADLTEAVQDIVGAFFGAGTGASVTYNDAANTITVSAAGTSDPETIRDTIGAALVGVGNISVVVNDAADTITISTTATVNATDAALRDRSTHTGTQAATTITGLATVATTGSYADLSGKPTIPTAYTDEQAQDAAAALLTSGAHTGVTFTYDDAGNRVNAVVTGTSSGVSWTVPAGGWHQVYPGASGALALTAGSQLLWPFTVPGDIPTATLRFEVHTAAASSTIRAGYYLPEAATGLPDLTTLVDFGTFDSSATGFKDLTRSLVTVPRGKLLWLTVLALGGAPTLRALLTVAAAFPHYPLPSGVAPATTGSAWGLSVATGGRTDLATTSQTLAINPGIPVRASFRNDTP